MLRKDGTYLRPLAHRTHGAQSQRCAASHPHDRSHSRLDECTGLPLASRPTPSQIDSSARCTRARIASSDSRAGCVRLLTHGPHLVRLHEAVRKDDAHRRRLRDLRPRPALVACILPTHLPQVFVDVQRGRRSVDCVPSDRGRVQATPQRTGTQHCRHRRGVRARERCAPCLAHGFCLCVSQRRQGRVRAPGQGIVAKALGVVRLPSGASILH